MRFLLLLSACATMRGDDLPPGCRDDYNVCLDSCANRAPPGPVLRPGTADYDTLQRNNARPPYNDVGCTKRCDENARACAHK